MPTRQESTDILHPSEEEALASWAYSVKRNRQQAERFREAPEHPDFYAPTAASFKADAHRTGDQVLDTLGSMVKQGETWLDIGAGAGRNALPLALRAREVIALDPSQAMLENLRASMADNNIDNIRVIEDRWPVKKPPKADVALISNVGYDIENIGPFLDAMESSVNRLCIAVLSDREPTLPAHFAWPIIHGETRLPLPGLREFLVLQIARKRLCEVRLISIDTTGQPDRGAMPSFLRQQLFIQPGGRKDKLLGKLIEQRVAEQRNQPTSEPRPHVVGVVSWVPAR